MVHSLIVTGKLYESTPLVAVNFYHAFYEVMQRSPKSLVMRT